MFIYTYIINMNIRQFTSMFSYALAIFAILYIPVKPTYLIARNILSPNQPTLLPGKYKCTPDILKDITVIVSVKDTCSQSPIFIESLKKITTKDTPLIYTYPAYAACEAMKPPLKYWRNVRTIPVDLSDSPMSGWVKGSMYVNTKYSYLVHNDGYAMRCDFLCELYGALSLRNESYVVAAPMLYENKEGGGLGAHATQANLQIVPADNKYGFNAFHEHSFIKSLNRGEDSSEGEQSEFLEDHGFLIKSNYILDVIDDKASFTLEYLDMILNLRNIDKKVVFVPSAALEFRVTQFMLQDIPYFAYKRSEEIAHKTRDYISTKWQVGVPNTGFWTYIKYTILEQHVYCGNALASLSWREQLMTVFGFFQISGYNRYKWSSPRYIPLTKVVYLLDGTRMPPAKKYIAYRSVKRPVLKPKHINNVSRLIGKGNGNVIEMTYEYNAFVVYMASYKCINQASIMHICNVIIASTSDICICWGHVPIHKRGNVVSTYSKVFASLLKIPSRVTTYLEMLAYKSQDISHIIGGIPSNISSVGIQSQDVNLTLYKCGANQEDCYVPFEFDKHMSLTKFYGGPISLYEFVQYVSKLLQDPRYDENK
ncbi:hypothetical protein EXVG_00301 [Emiliania huxleyi virus 202]|nr:hypothetical protein EXVG_00301 [Emiliania huxleyi virus 202]